MMLIIYFLIFIWSNLKALIQKTRMILILGRRDYDVNYVVYFITEGFLASKRHRAPVPSFMLKGFFMLHLIFFRKRVLALLIET